MTDPAGVDPHPATAELAYLSVSEIRDRYGARSLSASELVGALRDRIAALDEEATPTALRAVAAVSDDVAQRAADRDADGSGIPGPLDGIPVLIKDNIEAEGLPGVAGSTALVGRPAREAPLVARLRAAGALILGAANLSEWANIRSAHSTSGWSATGGLVANPWALDRSAGGSSSGSGAALAAGLVPLAVGTETDGSIVCPSSLNGVVGLKPTVGSIPTRYVVPISASQDSPGPMGRCVSDVALLFSVLASQDPRETPTPSIGYATTWRSGHPPTDDCADQVVEWLRRAGHAVTECRPPEPGETENADEGTVLLAELCDDLSAYLADRPGPGPTSLAAVIAHEDATASVELPYFGHDFFVNALATGGRRGPAYTAARARNLEWAMRDCLTPAFREVDVVLAVGFGPAWKSDLAYGGSPTHAASCVTQPAAIAGWPIITLPVGLVHGLPVGVALVGRPHDEWTLLHAARIVEGVVAAHVSLGRPTWRSPERG